MLAATDRVRLVLDNPPTVAEATREPGGGLALDLEIDAAGGAGRLSLEAFSATGALIGVGESGPLPLGAIDGTLTLYVAPPHSIGAAPVALEPPRSEIAVAALSFGAILIGGNDGSGLPTADVDVYNIYDHAFQVGVDLERPRAGATATAGATGVIYIFGGTDTAGDISAPLAFNTNVAPAGAYFDIAAPAGLERSGVEAASLGGEDVVIAGEPAVRIDGIARTAVAIESAPPLLGTLTTSRTASETLAVAVGDGTGTSGGARVGAVNVVEVSGPAELLRSGHAATADESGDVYVVGGADQNGAPLLSGLRYRAATGEFVVLPDLLDAPRFAPAIAATDRFLIVAGGADELGAALFDALIIDLATLDVVATIEMAGARVGGRAVALANHQVLLVGGRDADGAVIATLELFTPPL